MTRNISLIIFAMLMADPAYAYMGPGSGLAFLGSLAALVGAMFVGLLGFVWYPVKRLIRGRREREDDAD